MRGAGTRTRWLNAVNATVLIASVLALIVAVNVFAQRSELRNRIDATKTRAYSLSEQTTRLLDSLDEQWTIALVMVEDRVDRSARRQIEEVLERYLRASPNITVQRINPADPGSLAEYESLIARLRSIYRDTIDEYDDHIDRGVGVFEDLLVYARQESGQLEQFVQLLDPESPGLDRFRERAQMLGLIAEQGEDILREIHNARQITDSRPIPDYDTAHSVLAQALSQSANELVDLTELLEQWTQGSVQNMDVQRFLTRVQRELEQWSRRLARALDPLMHLPPMELSIIGEKLEEGEAIVIVGPDAATVIPSEQLFPMTNIRRAGGDGGVRFDQRFRGEQLLSAAMRSLTVEHMPMVTFVHAEERSLLRSSERNADVMAMALALNASRFTVEEWAVGETERPQPAEGQPTVWVVVPPWNRPGLEPTERETALIRTTRQLIDEGEPILLSVYPSRLPRYGQTDPWARLAESLDMSAETSMAIFESTRVEVDRVEVQRGLAIQNLPADHLIARAVHGQQLYLSLPVPIMPFDDIGPEVTWTPLIVAEPTPTRWLEPEWHAETSNVDPAAKAEHLFDEPLSLAMAIERPCPRGRGQQRAIVVGAGGWMLSFIADAAVQIGGDRLALSNPGNRELLLSAAAWLAGMDELVAPSPMSQDVARLGEISERAGTIWFWIIVVGLPAVSLLVGLSVWGIRRT